MEDIVLTIAILSKLYTYSGAALTRNVFLLVMSLLVQKLPVKEGSFFDNLTKHHQRKCSESRLLYGCVVYVMCFDDMLEKSYSEKATICSLITISLLLLLKAFSVSLSYFVLIILACIMTTCFTCYQYLDINLYVEINSYEVVNLYMMFCITVFVCAICCTQSYSVGESIIIGQMTVFLFTINLSSTYIDQPVAEVYDNSNFVYFCVFLARLVCSIFIVCSASIYIFNCNPDKAFYLTLFCVTTILSALYAHYFPVFFSSMFSFMFGKFPNRQFLILYWFVISCFCSAFTVLPASKGYQAKMTTVHRKVYHLFLLLVYIPGIAIDPLLLSCCSAIVACAFLIVSIVVAYKVAPFGKYINDILQPYTSSQDSGEFILTPFCLLLGASFPVWLNCYKYSHVLLHESYAILPISSYSGLLSVGVGDSAASIMGSKFGKHKVLGSEKSLEGTLSSIVSQSLVLCTFKATGLYNLSYWLIYSVVIVSFAEVFTKEIDNLVLPILMYFLQC